MRGRRWPVRPDVGRTVVYEGAPARAARPPWLLGAAALAVIALAWEAAARLQWVPPLFLPAPTAVFREAAAMARSGELGRHLGVSLARVGLGFGLGAAVGTMLGIGLGWSRTLWAVGNPVIAATYPIPKIALLPLMILWLGIGEAPKVTMIALGVFFPVVINTYAGVQGTDPLMVKAARSLGAGSWQIVQKVVLPSALPTILAGYRLGAGIALLLVVSAEMINATAGIGFLILHSGDLMLTGKLMVGLATLSILGLASTWALRGLEAWLAPWKEEGRR
jgi:NitT/TauT family transport system permease protein